MTHQFPPPESSTNRENLASGISLIVLLGIGLGLAYNLFGQRGGTWGLDWIGREPTADLAKLPTPTGARTETGLLTNVDDPLAFGGGGLSEIPEIDRPIQIELSALKQYYDAGVVILVDARSPEEFAEGHIRGAVNLPFEAVATDPVRLEQFDPDGKAIVTYCGGGSCEMSIELAQLLLFQGHRKVLVFMGGFPEWVDANYPRQVGVEG